MKVKCFEGNKKYIQCALTRWLDRETPQIKMISQSSASPNAHMVTVLYEDHVRLYGMPEPRDL